jgi:hypothetical protein
MNLNHCPQEASLIAALASGSIPHELDQHAGSCAVCQDARLVWTCLHDPAYGDAHADLPSPGVIWWRAQLAKKRAAAQRSVAAIRFMQTAALVAAILGFIAVAAWESTRLNEISPLLLGGAAATLLVFVASVLVVVNSARRSSARSM